MAMVLLQPNQNPQFDHGIVAAQTLIPHVTMAVVQPTKNRNMAMALLQPSPNPESDYGIVAAKTIIPNLTKALLQQQPKFQI